jgi:hypothetical protein
MREASEYHRPPRGRLLLVILALGSLAALIPAYACGGGVSADSGIEGVVTLGPISPVSTPGSPNKRPYSATLKLKSLPDTELVAEVVSDEQGVFRTALEPGRYLVEPQNGDPLPVAASQEVVVFAGQYTHVEIDYDSGIR